VSIPHVTLQIRDVEVLFPYQPYEPQIKYMEQGDSFDYVDV